MAIWGLMVIMLSKKYICFFKEVVVDWAGKL